MKKRLSHQIMRLYYYSKQLKQDGGEASVDIERRIKSPETDLRI